MYGFLGYTALASFDARLGTFEQTMNGFQNLTDPARINVEPDLVALKKVTRAGPLRLALVDLGVAAGDLEAHAVMNGMELTTTVAAGALLKVVAE